MRVGAFLRYLSFALLFFAAGGAYGQPETMAWSNLNGIRIEGQLMEFGTSLAVVEPDWLQVFSTGKERQTTSYNRSGKTETVKLQLQPRRERRDQPLPSWSFSAVQVVEDLGDGAARLDVQFEPKTDAEIAGAFLRVELPASFYSGGRAQLVDAVAPAPSEVSLAAGVEEVNEYVRAVASGILITGRRRQLEISFDSPTEVIVRDDRRQGSYDLHVYLTVLPGRASAGQSARKVFTIKASGEVDKAPVELALNAASPGQRFDGMGGNFRLQNAKLDPQVIDYNLNNVRMSWARVEMPWQLWHPNEEVDPLEAARAGKLNPRVHDAMEMARRLTRLGMPVIVSAWFPPAWAVLGNAAGGGPRGPRGAPLNPEKMNLIRESLAGYLLFLKEKYGVEAAMFSFNESDLGINVRQTPREHAELIKTLGPYFAQKGLATKLLLGDTSDARPVDFIRPAMQDPEAVRWIGAVSFHSWRGCTDEILAQWYAAARELNVPLLVGEGSTDAAAYRYPQIFLEQSFALYEINLYVRILALSQPKSILQWQMTSDYSLLVGGGVFGDTGPLRPTQRFWNLKQLASTPPQSFHLPIACKGAYLNCAAFGNTASGAYAVHVVNNGAARQATLTGVPAAVKQFRVFVTDAQRGMQELAPVPVVDGTAQFTLDATSFVSLISTP